MGAVVAGVEAIKNWYFSTESEVPVSSVYMPTSTGIAVTQNKALTVGAYWACIQNIASDLAKLPLGLYRREAENRSQRIFTGDRYRMLNVLSDEALTAYSMRQTAMQWTLGEGNGLAEIITNGRNEPLWLKPIEPLRVCMDRTAGNVVYHVSASSNDEIRDTAIDLAPEEVIHFKGMGTGYWGYSVLRYQAECLATSLATQEFANRFFSNGTMAGAVISHPDEVTSETYLERLKTNIAQLRERENQQKALILEQGGTFTPLSAGNRDAQFFETMGLTVREIARWFRMPLHMIQDMEGAKFNNVEMTGIEYVKDALLMWAVMMEQELNYKLFNSGEEVYVEHDFASLLRGDSKARAEYYKARHAMGSMTGNQIRDKEGDSPGPEELDEYYMQLNMSTVSAIAEGKNLKDGTDRDEDGFPKGDTDQSDRSDRSDNKLQAFSLDDLFLDAGTMILDKEKNAITRKLARMNGRNGDEGTIAREITNFYGDLILTIDRRLHLLCNKVGYSRDRLKGFADDYCARRCDYILKDVLRNNSIATFKESDSFITDLIKFKPT